MGVRKELSKAKENFSSIIESATFGAMIGSGSLLGSYLLFATLSPAFHAERQIAQLWSSELVPKLILISGAMGGIIGILRKLQVERRVNKQTSVMSVSTTTEPKCPIFIEEHLSEKQTSRANGELMITALSFMLDATLWNIVEPLDVKGVEELQMLFNQLEKSVKAELIGSLSCSLPKMYETAYPVTSTMLDRIVIEELILMIKRGGTMQGAIRAINQRFNYRIITAMRKSRGDWNQVTEDIDEGMQETILDVDTVDRL